MVVAIKASMVGFNYLLLVFCLAWKLLTVSNCWGLFRFSKQKAEYKFVNLIITPVLSNSVLTESVFGCPGQMSKESITFKKFKQVHLSGDNSLDNSWLTVLLLLYALPEICEVRVTCNEELTVILEIREWENEVLWVLWLVFFF